MKIFSRATLTHSLLFFAAAAFSAFATLPVSIATNAITKSYNLRNLMLYVFVITAMSAGLYVVFKKLGYRTKVEDDESWAADEAALILGSLILYNLINLPLMYLYTLSPQVFLFAGVFEGGAFEYDSEALKSYSLWLVAISVVVNAAPLFAASFAGVSSGRKRRKAERDALLVNKSEYKG